jgi:hypothetical protein
VDGNFRCAASPDAQRAVPQGYRWQISCHIRSCKKKRYGPAACAKTRPRPPMVCGEGSREASVVRAWVECTACSNDLPGSGRRNQLLGGWFCGKGHWDEWHSTEAKVQAVTPIPDGLVLSYRSKWKSHARSDNRRPKGVPRWCIPRFNGGGSGPSSSSASSGSASGSSSTSALADMKSRLRGDSGVSSALVTATSSAARRSELMGAAAEGGGAGNGAAEVNARRSTRMNNLQRALERALQHALSSPSPLRECGGHEHGRTL